MDKFRVEFDGFIFEAPSRRKNKKYDAYTLKNKYITSFGDNRYEQYYDKIGFYGYMDHYDDTRRHNYKNRHRNDNLNYKNPSWFSWRYLW
jgi:hypothetical protein